MNKERYYELIRRIKEHGHHTIKSNGYGYMVTLVPITGYTLQLDTYNCSIVCYKWLHGNTYEKFKNIGIDWGGFECSDFWTEYFLAHIKTNKNDDMVAFTG